MQPDVFSFKHQYPNRYASILVIIPAYNEQSNIGQVIKGVQHAAGFADILVINDGSQDATTAIARHTGASVLELPFNLGIGGAVQAGIRFAHAYGYPFVARLDADGQHNPKDIPRLLATVMQGKADVAIGSRFCKGEVTYRPPLGRRLGITYFSCLVSALVGRRITDTTSGLQCMNRWAIECFANYYPQDYPEVEAHILMKKAGLRVQEIPVEMRPRRSGSSSINYLRSVYYMFKVTLAVIIAFLRTRPGPIRTFVSHEEKLYVTTTQDLDDSDQFVSVDDHLGIGT